MAIVHNVHQATCQPICDMLSSRLSLCSQVVAPGIEAHWVLWKIVSEMSGYLPALEASICSYLVILRSYHAKGWHATKLIGR